MKKSLLTLCLATTMLTACVSSESPQNSNIPTPSLWTRLTSNENAPLVASEQAAIEHGWWKHFNDPILDALIIEAINNNKTLAIANERIAEARAGRLLNQSALFPQIYGNAGIRRANQGLLAGDKPVNLTEANVQASWEIDLFGGNQARLRQASAILESEEARRDAVRIALLAEVARTYFDARNFKRQVEITEENLETQRKTLSLVTDQFEQAFASNFDVQRVSAQVATTEAQLPVVKTAYEAALNRLAVLTGTLPGSKDTLLANAAPLEPLAPQILVSAPASVLAKRPDVRAAERQFAASISASDAAIAELFPKISLLALFGVQDSDTLNASANPWSLGADLVVPILNFGRIQSGIDAADAREQQAFLAYQQTVLEALEDMENALSSYGHEAKRKQSLHLALDNNRKATELSKQQFTNGYNSLLDVLIVERNLLDSESAQVASDTKLRQDLIGIYAAAGGGWRVGEPLPSAVAEPIVTPSSEPSEVSVPDASEQPEPVPQSIEQEFKPAPLEFNMPPSFENEEPVEDEQNQVILPNRV